MKPESKMRRIVCALLLTLGLCLTATTAGARSPRTSTPAKKQKTEKPKKVKKVKPPKLKSCTAYLCGVAYSEMDSSAYVTPVQQVDSVFLDGHTNFLADRQMYSTQLLAYLEEYYACKHAMPAVIYGKKPKRVAKLHAKVLRRFRKDTSWHLHELEPDEFTFKAERWVQTDGE